MSDDPLWDRAAHISAIQCLRINTTDELNDFYETKKMFEIYKDAAESEKIIKKELIALYTDRKAYITVMDELMEYAEKNQKIDEKLLWNEIKDIMSTENEKFLLDSLHKEVLHHHDD